MKLNSDVNPSLFIYSIVAVILLACILLCWHAFEDANRHRLNTEKFYNAQPRVKPLRTRLKWPGRFLSFFTSR